MSATAAASQNLPTGSALDKRVLRIAAVVALGSLMSILDTTIVNVAVNHLSREFSASLATIQWISTGYLLALATVIPLTGWAADRFGTKRLYMTSIVLFLVGSALSGLAWTAGSLIAFRVLQGFGGGMILPAGMTILTHAAGPQRIGRVMGIVGVPILLGPIFGPILGGYLVDDISWRWIFFVNIPIGAIALLVAVRVLDADEPKPHHQLDWKGLLLLSPGLAFFVYGLAETASGRGLDLVKIVAGVGLGLALILAFVVHARKRPGALIDVRLFGQRTVGASAATLFLFGAVFFGLALLMPLYFQVVRGLSALTAGELVAIQGVGAMITMPIGARLTDKIGAGKIVLVGLSLFAVAMLGLSQISDTMPLWQIELMLLVAGLGAGATMTPSMSAALGVLKRDEVARATSGLNVVLRIGGSIGTASLAVLLALRISQLLPLSLAGVGLGAIQKLPANVHAALLPRLGQAFGHAFLYALAISILSIIAALFLPRKGLNPVPGRDATIVE